jgi:hypothetical protein
MKSKRRTTNIGRNGDAVDPTRKNKYDDKREVKLFRDFLGKPDVRDYLKESSGVETGGKLEEFRTFQSKNNKKNFGWTGIGDINYEEKPSEFFNLEDAPSYLLDNDNKLMWKKGGKQKPDIEMVFGSGNTLIVDVERFKGGGRNSRYDKDGNEIFNAWCRKMKYLRDNPEKFFYVSFNKENRMSIINGSIFVDIEDRYIELNGWDWVRQVPVERVKRFYVK